MTNSAAEWLRACTMARGRSSCRTPGIRPARARSPRPASPRWQPRAPRSRSRSATPTGRRPARRCWPRRARIARSVEVPVTADIEDGYGLAPAELADRLLAAGLVGCNLEDSDPASRTLRDPAAQADYLAAVRQAAGPELVLNARVDVFVRPLPDGADAVAEAVRRARTYLAAGADCVYPIIAPAASIARLVTEIDGPVNAMARPGGPTIADLTQAGVARITFGSGLHTRALAAVRALRRRARGRDRRGAQDQRSGSESMP